MLHGAARERSGKSPGQQIDLETLCFDTTCYKTAQIKVDQTKNKNTDFYVENPNGKNHETQGGALTIIGGVLQYTRGQTLYVLSIWRNSLSHSMTSWNYI